MATTKSTNTSTPKKRAKKGTVKQFLTKRYDLPVKGWLGKDIRAPRWLRAIGSYFSGSWAELQEVRWPTRRATWSLTLAVIVFTSVFMAMTLGLDFVFELLIKKVIL